MHHRAFACIATAGLATTVILGGCQLIETAANIVAPSVFSTKKYEPMPADWAHARMKADRELLRSGEDVAGLFGSEADLDGAIETAVEKAESRAQSADVPDRALNEMADTIAQWIVEDVPEPDYKAALVIGRLRGAESDPELQHVLDTLAVKLLQNETFSSRFAILTSTRSEASELIEQYSGDPRDYLNAMGTNIDKTRIQEVHPDDLYVLHGSLRRSKEGLVLHVSANIMISKPRIGEAASAESFRRSYYFHPANLAFESQDENDLRWDEWIEKHPKSAEKRTSWRD